MDLRENKVCIIAFEVANTIVKGSNLMQSLSEENIQTLKKEILSEGVQLLVSTDSQELLHIVAFDKREELDVFSREVVRFGDMCKDPQWHNLNCFFSRLDTDLLTNQQLREEAEFTMQELTNLAQYTSTDKTAPGVNIIAGFIHMIYELMETNLRQIIKSLQALTKN